MCFSAPVSFAASAGLVTLGAATQSKLKGNERYIVIIPYLFALQQFLEGLVWIFPAQTIFGHGFLMFAFIVWPILIPALSYVIEQNNEIKKRLKIILGTGIVVAVYLLIILLTHPLTVSTQTNHIHYGIDFPYLTLTGIAYVGVIFGSLYLTTKTAYKFFGVLMFISALISLYIYTNDFTSTWCFFAALLSSLILIYAHKQKS